MTRRIGSVDPSQDRIEAMLASRGRTEITRLSAGSRQTYEVDEKTGALTLTKSDPLRQTGSNPVAALLKAFGKDDGFDDPKPCKVALS